MRTGRHGASGRARWSRWWLAGWLVLTLVASLLSGRGAGAAGFAPVAPADGSAVAATDAPVFQWTPLAGATAYRVVFGDGERTGPWVAAPDWQSGSLPAGGYRWHVVAKLGDRELASPEAAFTVSEPGTTGETSLAQPAPAGDADASSKHGKVDGLDLAPADPVPAATFAVSDAPVSDALSPPPAGPGRVPLLSLAGDAAVVGTVLTVYGTGFAPGEPVDLRWRPSDRPGMELPTADADGAWTVALLVPDVPGGPQTLRATGTASGDEATVPLAILPALTRDPAGGAPGSDVVLSASGFGPDEEIAVTLADAAADAAPLATATTGGNGTVRFKLTIPKLDPGLAGIVAVGATSGFRAEGTLRIDPVVRRRDGDAAPAATALEQVGRGGAVGVGSYAVLAAPVGEVGGTTSSGHVVQAGDRYASLPVCTTTACPWLDPGTNHPVWGTRVECGEACLVRVADPATGRCTVAPVLDTGPWFTGDDWWSPADRRRVNRAPGAVYQLAEGYPAAQAARDGYDLGFGLAPDGIGISDQGYEVGNGAAVGLGPGAWADLGLAPGSGPAQAVVTLLWLSGDDPATAKAACDTAANAPLAAVAAPTVATAVPSPAVTPAPAPANVAPAAGDSPAAPVAAPPAATATPAATPATLSASPDGATASPGQQPQAATPDPHELDAAQPADPAPTAAPAANAPADAQPIATSDAAEPTVAPDADPAAVDPAPADATDTADATDASGDPSDKDCAKHRDRKSDDPGTADDTSAPDASADAAAAPPADATDDGGYGGTRLGLRADELRTRHGLGPQGTDAPAETGDGSGS